MQPWLSIRFLGNEARDADLLPASLSDIFAQLSALCLCKAGLAGALTHIHGGSWRHFGCFLYRSI
jgi:hypothetical protein